MTATNSNARAPFRCPICRSQRYEAVVVRRTSAKPYTTEFFECAGCSVMFRDPVRFTRFEPYVAPPAAPDFKRTWLQPATTAADTNKSPREAKRAARAARS
jgi:hypothetical protein